MNSQFSRSLRITALGTAGLLGAVMVFVGCSAPADSSGSASAAQTALPDDTDDTTFVHASKESTSKYGVAYWGETPDVDRNATTTVGYDANQKAIVNLRYDIDSNFVLDLTGPGVETHVKFSPDTSPSTGTGVTDAAFDLYNQIVADAEAAADENDEQVAPPAADTTLVTHSIHPDTTLTNPSYSKQLVDKCWTLILPCRAQSRTLAKNLQKLLVNPKSCSGAWKLLSDCKLQNQSCTNLQNSAVSSNGASCGAGVSQQRDGVKTNRASCESQRTSCLKNGGPPSPAPVKSGSCPAFDPSSPTQCT